MAVELAELFIGCLQGKAFHKDLVFNGAFGRIILTYYDFNHPYAYYIRCHTKDDAVFAREANSDSMLYLYLIKLSLTIETHDNSKTAFIKSLDLPELNESLADAKDLSNYLPLRPNNPQQAQS